MGVGVEFCECMHTWGMIEIRGYAEYQEKAYKSITINDVRTSKHKYKNNVMFYNAFHLSSGPDSAPCPMLRSLDAQTLLKDLHIRGPPSCCSAMQS